MNFEKVFTVNTFPWETLDPSLSQPLITHSSSRFIHLSILSDSSLLIYTVALILSSQLSVVTRTIGYLDSC